MASDDLPSAGVFKGCEHRLPVRVYYEDTDFTGLVYHASYIRFFERGRSDFLRLAGAGHVAMAALDTAFAVVRLEVDFRRAAGIDDALVVATRIAWARGPRLRFAQEIERSGEMLCSAGVEAACIDPAGRPRRPPPELSRALSPYLPGL
ncbi:YbgC/FadM family acyl-CoA thioesterase [Caulobacter sp. S45]|uniref:YbgC/FadM family acyl-CoA thioesterase n=1 Tax=Caulobacter sp. S45 TaxID=1641861 RepID=UPI0027385E1B|nr:YbgC/FadM family acyl-CoA thioesterase [Caulobacter sp. S45]